MDSIEGELYKDWNYNRTLSIEVQILLKPTWVYWLNPSFNFYYLHIYIYEFYKLPQMNRFENCLVCKRLLLNFCKDCNRSKFVTYYSKNPNSLCTSKLSNKIIKLIVKNWGLLRVFFRKDLNFRLQFSDKMVFDKRQFGT